MLVGPDQEEVDRVEASHVVHPRGPHHRVAGVHRVCPRPDHVQARCVRRGQLGLERLLSGLPTHGLVVPGRDPRRPRDVPSVPSREVQRPAIRFVAFPFHWPAGQHEVAPAHCGELAGLDRPPRRHLDGGRGLGRGRQPRALIPALEDLEECEHGGKREDADSSRRQGNEHLLLPPPPAPVPVGSQNRLGLFGVHRHGRQRVDSVSRPPVPRASGSGRSGSFRPRKPTRPRETRDFYASES